MRARARPLFLRTVFQILLRISQSKGKNENPKTDISALKSVFGFRLRLEIRNPDFENLNPDFPIKRTLKVDNDKLNDNITVSLTYLESSKYKPNHLPIVNDGEEEF